MTLCPCCSHRMLRQVGNRKVYWFCRHCWQEMPSWDELREHESIVDRNYHDFERQLQCQLEGGNPPQIGLESGSHSLSSWRRKTNVPCPSVAPGRLRGSSNPPAVRARSRDDVPGESSAALTDR
ncbi:MAG: hypothetical protein SWY16_03945 [Cyanobacteriota bacterium]|nr:hypothetical protein [Cyanobacteriota bacterium]